MTNDELIKWLRNWQEYYNRRIYGQSEATAFKLAADKIEQLLNEQQTQTSQRS